MKISIGDFFRLRTVQWLVCFALLGVAWKTMMKHRHTRAVIYSSLSIDELKMLVARGDKEARVPLGVRFLTSSESNRVYEGFEMIKAQAITGDPNAAFNLATCYLKGSGCKVNGRESVGWFQKAAKEGIPEAMVALGLILQEGVFAPKDPARSFRYFRAAADLGYPQAHWELGICHQNGLGRR